MKPYSKYVFQKKAETLSRYLLVEHYGADIPQFPAIYKRGDYKGMCYIGFRPTQRPQVKGHRYFTHTFELSDNKTFTGVNFTEVYPLRAFGDDKSIGLNDCVLIEFSEDREKVTILFYKDMIDKSTSLFEKWTAGLLPETASSDCFLLNPKSTGKEKTDNTANATSL